MNLRLAAWIARRYLWSRSAGRFAPLLTATAIASIAMGTLALIVVMSVMRGFKRELTDRLLGFNAHITLTKVATAQDMNRGELESIFAGADVRDVAPFVQGEVIAASRAGGESSAQGARVRGIDPAELGAMGGVSIYFPPTSEGFSELSAGGRGLPGAVIGNEVVGQLMVHPDFGDEIELTAPLAEVGPSGELMPNRRIYRVAGMFRAGIYDLDSKYILLSIEEAKRLLGEQAVSGWQVRLADATDAPGVLRAMQAKLPEGWKAQGVDAQNKKLFAALALERLAMGAILVMVLAIASFAISGVILLITAAKRRDMAILEAVGVAGRRIRVIFMLNAAFIGAIGSCIGLAAGIGICLAAMRWPIRLPDSYYLDFLPVDLDPILSAASAAAGIAIAIVASLYPVRQASELNPAEALRYE
ncbi:MAG: ABC transporter permease [bacterium]